MAEPQRVSKEEVQLKVRWSEAQQLEQVIADELQLQLVNDRFYLTFGQIQIPVIEPEEGRTFAEIRPMGRFVVSRPTLVKIRDLLDRVLADKGQKP